MQHVSRAKKNQRAISTTKKNKHKTSSKNKISFVIRKTSVQVSRREELTCNKNQDAASSKNKIESACKELHEQNEFHEKKNHCTSFTK